eukprot:scaffold106462_cov51-Phaeocystis_antarctica.AAC.1
MPVDEGVLLVRTHPRPAVLVGSAVALPRVVKGGGVEPTVDPAVRLAQLQPHAFRLPRDEWRGLVGEVAVEEELDGDAAADAIGDRPCCRHLLGLCFLRLPAHLRLPWHRLRVVRRLGRSSRNLQVGRTQRTGKAEVMQRMCMPTVAIRVWKATDLRSVFSQLR